MIDHKNIQVRANQIGLAILVLVFFISFYAQFVWHDLPCPLCLLQRISFVGIGVAIIFNLFIEVRVRHYGMILLSSLLGLATATRQILLHIVPGDPGYGPPIFGLHIYTWSAIFFILCLCVTSCSLLFDKGFHKSSPSRVSKALTTMFIIMIAVNAVSALLECGLGACPANPTSYKLLS